MEKIVHSIVIFFYVQKFHVKTFYYNYFLIIFYKCNVVRTKYAFTGNLYFIFIIWYFGHFKKSTCPLHKWKSDFWSQSFLKIPQKQISEDNGKNLVLKSINESFFLLVFLGIETKFWFENVLLD